MSTYAQRVLTGAFPPSPHFTGVPYCELGTFVRRSENMTIWSFLPRGHWPLPVLEFGHARVIRTPPPPAEPGRLVHGYGRMRHQLLQRDMFRLVPAYLFGAAVIGRADGDIRPYTQSWEPIRRGRCPIGPR